ncbi:MAG: hypothetical protein QOE14_1882, partial [Humisphaera sp.]|nr:hypothetical protein [Humisphaera sp.]
MRRKRSVRVIFAALLLLLPGLVATVALVRDVVQISQGAPPPPPMFSAQKAEELKQFVTGYRYTQLVIDAALFLLFVPPGWRLLRGRRFARAHATLVALLVAAG